MASSPTSIENQIDSFLEQFKRSASRAMEEHHHVPGLYSAASITHNHCDNLDLEVLEAGLFIYICHHFYSLIAASSFC